MNASPLILGAAETPYLRHPPAQTTTEGLLADAFLAALAAAGLRRDDVDGLAVSSFSLRPDTVIDLAWKLRLPLRWTMQSPLGGASGLDMLQHATRAIEAGDASTIVILSGDCFTRESFAALTSEYNRVTKQWLDPLPFLGPPSVFAMLTRRYMETHDLDRTDMAQVSLAQRRWAARNPNAAYRGALSLEEYLQAPVVADPLTIFDCVPVTAGADALVISARTPEQGTPAVRVRALAARHNPDNHTGDGLRTGLADLAPELWAGADRAPEDIDVVSVYDDFPVMGLVQLADLGLLEGGDVKRFLHERIARDWPVNTGGGMLSAGQSGAAGGVHGLVECVLQLQGRAGARQVPSARNAIVSGYGMVLYRYGACANAAILEAIS